MFEVNRHETAQIMAGKAYGLIRKFDDNCPILRGDEITFVSKYMDNSGRKIPFARAKVVAVQPATFAELKRSKTIVQLDGYPNAEVMSGSLASMFGPFKDTDKVYHIQFKPIEMDHSAGQRPDVDEGVKTVEQNGVTTRIN